MGTSPITTAERVTFRRRSSAARASVWPGSPVVCPSVSTTMCLAPAPDLASSAAAASTPGCMYVPPPEPIPRMARSISLTLEARVNGTTVCADELKLTTATSSRRLSDETARIAASLAICCCVAPVCPTAWLMEPEQSMTSPRAP